MIIKFKNIAAFAESGGEVDIKGKVTINGIGAFAKGNKFKNTIIKWNRHYLMQELFGGMVATEGGLC